MQQTTKYQFKLIEGSDDFSPQPLNDNVEKVEEALMELETGLGEVEDAYTPANKPYVIGTYTGNDGTVTVTLGFKPALLIIGGGISSGSPHHAKWLCVTDGTLFTDAVVFTDTGFYTIDRENSDLSPSLAEYSRPYVYIAFR